MTVYRIRAQIERNPAVREGEKGSEGVIRHQKGSSLLLTLKMFFVLGVYYVQAIENRISGCLVPCDEPGTQSGGDICRQERFPRLC